MAESNRVPVFIVGGDPVGLALALALDRFGIRLLVVEFIYHAGAVIPDGSTRPDGNPRVCTPIDRPGSRFPHRWMDAARTETTAFKLAGDPRAFPEQLGELAPWQPTRILHSVGAGGAGAGPAGGNETGAVKMEVGGNDPVLGESFASIAARSRAMHKTQGFGVGDGAVVGGSRWVQERGLYFPDQWDERFSAILASGDPGEMPLRGGLLVARHGRGYVVYTSLAWFRQLPEGVPGAYRLFANLVSLGK